MVRIEGEKVLDEWVHPKSRPEHQGWKDISVDIGRFAGEGRRLELVTKAFPDADGRFCTAGWGRAHLAARPLGPPSEEATFQYRLRV